MVINLSVDFHSFTCFPLNFELIVIGKSFCALLGSKSENIAAQFPELSGRELFISDATDTYPVSVLRCVDGFEIVLLSAVLTYHDDKLFRDN
jgi:hypothetical protein